MTAGPFLGTQIHNHTRRFAGDAPAGLPLAHEALALARQIGAPALIATGLLTVGYAAAEAGPEQARACLRESGETSAALGYQSPLDHGFAAAIAFLTGDQAATLELACRVIHGLRWGAADLPRSLAGRPMWAAPWTGRARHGRCGAAAERQG